MGGERRRLACCLVRFPRVLGPHPGSPEEAAELLSPGAVTEHWAVFARAASDLPTLRVSWAQGATAQHPLLYGLSLLSAGVTAECDR